MRLASVLHSGLIPVETVQIPEDGKFGFSADSSGFVQPSDIVCNSVTVKNTLYAKNMLVVVEVVNQDRIVAGWIRKVIVREEEIFFLVTTKVCRRTKMRYFQSEEKQGVLRLTHIDSLKTFKPLIPRGNEAFFCFFLFGKLLDDFSM
jgi:hypothetical protein